MCEGDETRNRDATVVKSKRKKKSLNKKKKWNGEKGDRREKGRTCLFMAVNKGQIYINIELLLVLLLLRFGRSVSRILPPSTDRNFLSVRPVQYVFTFLCTKMKKKKKKGWTFSRRNNILYSVT